MLPRHRSASTIVSRRPGRRSAFGPTTEEMSSGARMAQVPRISAAAARVARGGWQRLAVERRHPPAQHRLPPGVRVGRATTAMPVCCTQAPAYVRGPSGRKLRSSPTPWGRLLVVAARPPQQKCHRLGLREDVAESDQDVRSAASCRSATPKGTSPGSDAKRGAAKYRCPSGECSAASRWIKADRPAHAHPSRVRPLAVPVPGSCGRGA